MTYRLWNGFDHRLLVHMAVVVQRHGLSAGSSVSFYGRPCHVPPEGHLRGEATSALARPWSPARANADVARRERDIVARVATKQWADVRLAGADQDRRSSRQQEQPARRDAEVARLGGAGPADRAHSGCPQDIEWCLVDDGSQDRPKPADHHPLPDPGDRRPVYHVYDPSGHQRRRLAPIKPLGLSVWQQPLRPRLTYHAGVESFVDVTRALASPASPAWFVRGPRGEAIG